MCTKPRIFSSIRPKANKDYHISRILTYFKVSALKHLAFVRSSGNHGGGGHTGGDDECGEAHSRDIVFYVRLSKFE